MCSSKRKEVHWMQRHIKTKSKLILLFLYLSLSHTTHTQNGETGIDHETSSNLLPLLSTKSIALTNVLTQVLLNQYKNNSPFGESIAKDVDIKRLAWAKVSWWIEFHNPNEQILPNWYCSAQRLILLFHFLLFLLLAQISIMLAVEKANATSDWKVSKLPTVSQGEDLNLITPLSSMNVTPNEQDVISKFRIFIYTIYVSHCCPQTFP